MNARSWFYWLIFARSNIVIFFTSECVVLLCDFHREQAWERWLSTTTNGMRSQKDFGLSTLRSVAQAEDESTYNLAVEKMKKTEFWNSSHSKKLKHWIEKTWLSCHKVFFIHFSINTRISNNWGHSNSTYARNHGSAQVFRILAH
jgi:hypothetical protein